MGWNCVSELRPSTGLLVILQMIYEYGEPRWNDIDGKTEELGGKNLSLPLYPQQIPHGRTWVQTQGSASNVLLMIMTAMRRSSRTMLKRYVMCFDIP
jgi:hypothetical protein